MASRAMRPSYGVLALILFITIASLLVVAVDKSKFRTCDQTAFCKRLRKSDSFVAQDFEVVGSSIVTDDGKALLVADLKSAKYPLMETIELRVAVIRNGVVRQSVREKRPRHARWEPRDVLQESALSPFVGVTWRKDDTRVVATYGQNEVIITLKPFNVQLNVRGVPAISGNDRGLLTFEVYRDKNPKPEGPAQPTEGTGEVAAPEFVVPEPKRYPYDIDGMWEEKFQSHTDTKPRGPSAIGMDFAFLGSEHVYGIPEHASSFALKSTTGGSGAYNEPYRLWNLDVFEYELDVPMALYGAVPFMISHDHDKTTGVLWLNTAETYIDVADAKDQVGNPKKQSHWLSESGIIDAFLFPGPLPHDLFFQYNSLTGMPSLPQRFAIAYHQCRWNYKNEQDVREVDAGFDEHDIPYDVLWLDIEHTDGKKYFTWDKSSFPTPKDMQNALSAKSRKMVTIIDPHIKRDSGYRVHKDAQNRDMYVKNAEAKGGEYEGWCWPGSVSYLDFLLPEVRAYWASLFQLSEYEGSTTSLYTWNDMNEPSVFNGPEVTMPKDCLHEWNSVEHRDVHNQYGFYHQMATHLGHLKRDNARSFVLTRSFFAGSQQYGAVWTGDNKAEWSHLQAAQPMLLSLGVAGITFSGADVGGFFGDPDAELLTRWYQTAAFQPFFRGHAHIDAKRREPWLFGEPYTSLIRDAIRTRYSYLPYVYSVFHTASVTGLPIMRPLWSEFPLDKETYAMEDQFMLGDSLLIRPVTKSKETSVNVYLPGSQPWYDVKTFQQYAGAQTLSVSTPLSKIPVFQRGGTIIPKRERARRNSALMEHDPFTLIIALDRDGAAAGSLYLDDGSSFAHKAGAFVLRAFSFSAGRLTATSAAPGASSATAGATTLVSPATSTAIATAPANVKATPGTYTTDATLERIVLWGVRATYTRATLKFGSREVELTLSQSGAQVVIRKPDVPIATDFTIQLS